MCSGEGPGANASLPTGVEELEVPHLVWLSVHEPWDVVTGRQGVSGTSEGGEGAMDLWMSTRTSVKAPFGQALNLGAPVNSPRLEAESALSADGLILVFDAWRNDGQGGLDLWMSTRTDTAQSNGAAKQP